MNANMWIAVWAVTLSACMVPAHRQNVRTRTGGDAAAQPDNRDPEKLPGKKGAASNNPSSDSDGTASDSSPGDNNTGDNSTPDPTPEGKPEPKPAPTPPARDLKQALFKAGSSKGIKHPVTWNHAKSHGLAVSYMTSPKSTDYADIWLAKTVTYALEDLKALYKVAKVSHMGIYNYRKIAGSSNLSRHSYALAFDIGSFTLSDGTTLSVLKDWKHATKGPILKAIRNKLCERFHVVLSPDYNAAHKNHFHVDLDPNRRGGEEKAPFWSELSNKFSVFDPFGFSHLAAPAPLTDVEVEQVTQATADEGDEGLSVINFAGNTCK